MPHWTFYKTTDDSNSLPEADQKKVRTTPDTVYDALSRWRRQIVGYQNHCRQWDLCFLGFVKTEISPHCQVSLGERPRDNEYSRSIRNGDVGFRHASLWLQMQCGHIYTLMETLICGAGVYLEAAAAGICIAEQENFHETLHVAHLRHDPDRYWDVVQRTWLAAHKE
ncbi:hypothetical protein C8Q69DRAFT_454525 [Paecilomyces variotii]|uniref:Uncharacterized protein n=1 Tax=Byssochlamys spectabilis TaxID=264951 RepID=A0A443I8D8_BYSSP|nr:hypothetical protein C8Q69DRAFT_454525 [Paecilomyces variotii]RWR00332.1 hypothetical protein C8Q69DRAFT_454525 [Paecilomyces variotii]